MKKRVSFRVVQRVEELEDRVGELDDFDESYGCGIGIVGGCLGI